MIVFFFGKGCLMPPFGILREVRRVAMSDFVGRVPRRWRRQFRFGFEAFGLRPFRSAGSNARSVVLNRSTASSRVDRLLANEGLAGIMGEVFDTLGIVTEDSFVGVDHSEMNGLIALVGGVQTYDGRAVPCMVETTFSPTIPTAGCEIPRLKRLREAKDIDNEKLTDHTIVSLGKLAVRLGFWPNLVFDRGYANETIIKYLSDNEVTFYIRFPKGRYVENSKNRRLKIGDLETDDETVNLYKHELRIIRSDLKQDMNQPWYIVTNDTNNSRNKIVDIYYHRFEIEETFKDIKHIYELKRVQFNKPNSLKIVLWFITLGIATLYKTSQPQKPAHPKKRISWLRHQWEQLQQATTTPIYNTT